MTESFVDYGRVADLEQVLFDAYNTIAQIISDTEAAISKLEDTWSGNSQEEYQGVQQRWMFDIQLMNEALGEYIGTFSQMATNPNQDLILPMPQSS